MTVESLPLRGRQDELAVIEDRLREVSAGTGGAVVIEGSAGVGKTKLIDASMQLAEIWGFVSVAASSSRTGRVRPNSKLSSTLFSRGRRR